MAQLNIPDQAYSTRDIATIRTFLNQRGVWFDQWQASVDFAPDADQDTVLAAYADVLQPFMAAHQYRVADVININAATPNYEAIRAKFLSEHTHTEDEVRFFVDGKGLFWFHLSDEEPIFNLLCEAGDLISVPAHTRHWFDAGAENPHVKAIRIFIDTSGWVPHYTGSDISQKYSQAQS
jgi:1,2-dihydroxy-3-keto-5-methylthiopentene dioxygenase